jgi:predicted glycosyltransferase
VTARVLFHVNHLWGVGHFARIAAIANALVEAGGAATVLAGNAVPPGRLDARVKLVELPVIRAADPTYARLVDAAGAPVSAGLWARRAQLIDEALAASAPQVLVTETFPFGRRKLAAELLHLAGAAKSQGAKIAASIRDLPTAPADTRRLEDCAGRLRAHYDAVLIHGDPTIAGLNEIWPGEIPVPARFTGDVTAAIPPAAEARRGVVVSAGGAPDCSPQNPGPSLLAPPPRRPCAPPCRTPRPPAARFWARSPISRPEFPARGSPFRAAATTL